MKKLKNRFGLVIISYKKKDDFGRYLNVLFDKPIYKLKGEYKSVSHYKKLDSNYFLWQINGNVFKTYAHFDRFLLEISKMFDDLDAEGGLVLGHNDLDGYFWMDYSDFHKGDEAVKL